MNRNWARERYATKGAPPDLGWLLHGARTEHMANGCIEWRKSLTSHGYGQIMTRVDGKQVIRKVHDLVWEITNRPIEKGEWAIQVCENRKCINPDHLFLSTKTESKHVRARASKIMFAKRHAEYRAKIREERKDRLFQGLARDHSKRKHHFVPDNGHKLSDADVLNMRELYIGGMSQYTLAKQYGVTQQRVQQIMRGECYLLVVPASLGENPYLNRGETDHGHTREARSSRTQEHP